MSFLTRINESRLGTPTLEDSEPHPLDCYGLQENDSLPEPHMESWSENDPCLFTQTTASVEEHFNLFMQDLNEKPPARELLLNEKSYVNYEISVLHAVNEIKAVSQEIRNLKKLSRTTGMEFIFNFDNALRYTAIITTAMRVLNTQPCNLESNVKALQALCFLNLTLKRPKIDELIRTYSNRKNITWTPDLRKKRTS